MCDHSVGLYIDYGTCELVPFSELTEDKDERFNKFYVGDVDFFKFCPDCGNHLGLEEKYEYAVEVVQMPT